MKKMPLTFLALFLLAGLSLGADSKRGEYITKHVAMCVECHTPRTGAGALIESELFRGAPIPMPGPEWAETWAMRSMNIVGFNGWTDEQAVHFLQTGVKPNGQRSQLPMPQYRMSREDAEDVVAYLRNPSTPQSKAQDTGNAAA